MWILWNHANGFHVTYVFHRYVCGETFIKTILKSVCWSCISYILLWNYYVYCVINNIYAVQGIMCTCKLNFHQQRTESQHKYLMFSQHKYLKCKHQCVIIILCTRAVVHRNYVCVLHQQWLIAVYQCRLNCWQHCGPLAHQSHSAVLVIGLTWVRAHSIRCSRRHAVLCVACVTNSSRCQLLPPRCPQCLMAS